MKHSIVAALLLAGGLVLHAPAGAADVTVAVTADTEGHVNPCAGCPHATGQGGLARRATAVNGLRGAGALLLVDAGNALFGPESLDSGGAVIVDAYNRLGYDAVNLSFRDFRLGKDATLELLKRAEFPAISANVLDAATGQPLVRPYVVSEVGGRRVAIIGLAEQPAGLDYLPHLKRQLAGLRFAAPAEALAQSLPKARAEADVVLVLYYGPAAGAKRLADAGGKDLAAVLVGDARPGQFRPASVPLVGAAHHGTALTRLTLPARPGGAVGTPEELVMNDSVAADPGMEAFLAKTAPVTSRPPNPSEAAAVPSPDVGAAETETPVVRPLVQLEVKPLEPEPAPGAPEASETVTATAEKPAPAGVAEQQSPGKPTGGGVAAFLKSLVSRRNSGAAAGATAPNSDAPLNSDAPPDAPAAEIAPNPPAGATPEPAPPASSTTRGPRTMPGPGTATPAAPGPKFCTRCGTKLTPKSKFCTACGTGIIR